MPGGADLSQPDGTNRPGLGGGPGALTLRVTKDVQTEEMTGRENQFGLYMRDRWEVARNITVNLGLRAEIYPLLALARALRVGRAGPTRDSMRWRLSPSRAAPTTPPPRAA
jgi:hypothetical protein